MRLKRASWQECIFLSQTLLAPSKKMNGLRYALRLYFFHPYLIAQLDAFFHANTHRKSLWSQTEFKRDIYFQQMRRCFYKQSTAAERLQILQDHFIFFETTHTAQSFELIYGEGLQGLPPIQLHTGEHRLSVKLMYHHDFIREGFLGWGIELDGKILFKLTFWLMHLEGKASLVISAVQGGKATLEDNRDFTKYFHGIRPQNFALLIVRWYAEALGVENILSFPIENIWSKKIKDRDAVESFLQEQGAQVVINSPFVRLDLHEQRKAMEEIASKKRSQYKKRFDFIDQTKTLFQQEMENYFSTKARSIK